MNGETYQAYGLTISSDLRLPELPLAPARATADLYIRWGTLERPCDAERHFVVGAEEALLFWPECGAYRVRGGREIIVDAAPSIDEALVRLPLLGTALAVALHQRGLLVLHASAVALPQGVVAIVGEKGQGKSTLAAALYGRGHTMVADDVVVLDPQVTRPSVIPGFPIIKIWPDSAAASLGDDPEQLPRLAQPYEKRAKRLSARFATEPLPLRRIYTLAAGPELRIRPLPPQAMFAQLLPHIYMARFGEPGLHGPDAAAHLRRAMWLLGHAPLAAFERPRDLGRLGEAVDLIERELAALAAGSPAPFTELV